MGKDTSCKQQLQESQSSYTNTKTKQTFKKCYQRQRETLYDNRKAAIDRNEGRNRQFNENG